MPTTCSIDKATIPNMIYDECVHTSSRSGGVVLTDMTKNPSYMATYKGASHKFHHWHFGRGRQGEGGLVFCGAAL